MLDPATAATHLSPQDADSLRATARWARLLSIIGFILIGFMLLGGIMMGRLMAPLMGMGSEMMGEEVPSEFTLMGSGYLVVFVVLAAVYFVPALLLYLFATRTLRALSGTFDPITFTSALEAHRRLYKFMGILMVIVLGLHLLFLLFLVVGFGLFASNLNG